MKLNNVEQKCHPDVVRQQGESFCVELLTIWRFIAIRKHVIPRQGRCKRFKPPAGNNCTTSVVLFRNEMCNILQANLFYLNILSTVLIGFLRPSVPSDLILFFFFFFCFSAQMREQQAVKLHFSKVSWGETDSLFMCFMRQQSLSICPSGRLWIPPGPRNWNM